VELKNEIDILQDYNTTPIYHIALLQIASGVFLRSQAVLSLAQLDARYWGLSHFDTLIFHSTHDKRYRTASSALLAFAEAAESDGSEWGYIFRWWASISDADRADISSLSHLLENKLKFPIKEAIELMVFRRRLVGRPCISISPSRKDG